MADRCTSTARRAAINITIHARPSAPQACTRSSRRGGPRRQCRRRPATHSSNIAALITAPQPRGSPFTLSNSSWRGGRCARLAASSLQPRDAREGSAWSDRARQAAAPRFAGRLIEQRLAAPGRRSPFAPRPTTTHTIHDSAQTALHASAHLHPALNVSKDTFRAGWMAMSRSVAPVHSARPRPTGGGPKPADPRSPKPGRASMRILTRTLALLAGALVSAASSPSDFGQPRRPMPRVPSIKGAGSIGSDHRRTLVRVDYRERRRRSRPVLPCRLLGGTGEEVGDVQLR